MFTGEGLGLIPHQPLRNNESSKMLGTLSRYFLRDYSMEILLKLTIISVPVLGFLEPCGSLPTFPPFGKRNLGQVPYSLTQGKPYTLNPQKRCVVMINQP